MTTSHPIALQHNDQSVLERFHVAEAFKLAAGLRGGSPFSLMDGYSEFRRNVIALVLATVRVQV